MDTGAKQKSENGVINFQEEIRELVYAVTLTEFRDISLARLPAVIAYVCLRYNPWGPRGLDSFCESVGETREEVRRWVCNVQTWMRDPEFAKVINTLMSRVEEELKYQGIK